MDPSGGLVLLLPLRLANPGPASVHGKLPFWISRCMKRGCPWPLFVRASLWPGQATGASLAGLLSSSGAGAAAKVKVRVVAGAAAQRADAGNRWHQKP